MGNQQTTEKKGKNKDILLQTMNQIASKFILTQNFEDMKNLEKKEYCNKLVILTSDIIADKLDDLEITYLSQKIQKGNTVNKKAKNKVIYLKKEDLDNLDVKDTKTKFKRKQRMCIGIAKYYITIAHIFASIVKTINPVYSYKNDLGSTEKVDFFHKKKIPKNAVIKLSKKNICQNRINALIGKELKDVSENTIKPSFCNINKGETEKLKTLYDEPGIPELKKLYYDVFNYETGKFYKMSDESQEQYDKDLARFYEAFTGKSKDDSIKSFQDIKLVDYKQLKECKKDGKFRKSYKVSEDLFKQYGEHVASMMKTTNESQKELLEILKLLFVETKDGKITIHPLLTEQKLQKILETTRDIIINMYITCEEDFKKGLYLFEAIVEHQTKSNIMKKIENLEKSL